MRLFNQDASTRGTYREILVAEIADLLNRKTRALHQAPLGSLKPRRTSLDDIAFGQDFVWYPQLFDDVEGDLPRASWLVSRALLEKAKHERRRAWSWLLILAIGVSALAVSGTQDSLKALQFIGIEVAQLLNTAPL